MFFIIAILEDSMTIYFNNSPSKLHMKIIKLFLLLIPIISTSQQKFNAFREELIKSKKYEYVYNFENNYAVVRTFNRKMGLIDSIGNVVIKPNYEYIYNKEELKNLYEVGTTINKKFKSGYINIKGNIRIPLEYDDVFHLDKNLIRVTKNNRTGVVDTLNKIIIPLKFDFIMDHSGIIYAQSNNFVDIFDFSGKQLTNYKAKDIDYFTANRSIVTLQNNDAFIINNEGKTILEPIKNHRFEKIIDADSYIILNTITNKKGVINAKGEYDIECKYDDIEPEKSVYIAIDKLKSGLITKKDAILKPVIYDGLYPVNYKEDHLFQNQFLAEKGNLQGVIDPFSEKEIIKLQYKNVQSFENYYIVTNLENKNGLFSEKGDSVIAEDYEFYNIAPNKIFAAKNNKRYLLTLADNNYSEIEIPVDEFVKPNYFSTGFTKSNFQIFKNGNKFGVINNKNEIVVSCEFDAIENLSSTSQFIVKKNKKYGVVNDKSEILLDIKYDSYSFMKEYIKFEIKNQKGKKYLSANYSSNEHN